MGKTRLDALIVARGLAQSRDRARALVLAGEVEVDGRPVTKAGASVDANAAVTLRVPDHPWVGRGGLKLAHALDSFGVNPSGVTALDVGASTGGFTHVLLEGGAARVVALDVGHGQLEWKLRQDRRVVITRITSEGLQLLAELDHPMENVVALSLGHIGADRLRELIGLLERIREGRPAAKR